MEIALGSIIGPIYLIMGLSLLIYPDAWQTLMKNFEKDHFGLMAISFMNILLGLVVIKLYNVWAWNVFVLVTITGWGAFLKGVFYFLAPGVWTKTIIRAFNTKGYLLISGLLVIAMGTALSYYSYLA